MVYGRRIGDRDLTFEASGALLQATLVMRDRETDSWWSIITADAIGGPLEGTALTELPVGEKVQWSEWVRRHPQTRVLSIDGVEHVEKDPYADYFRSERTFRDLEIDDRRLPPKEPIFAFQLGGKAWAAPHAAVENGRVLRADEREIYLHRPEGASIFASTEAYRLLSRSAPENGSASGKPFDLETVRAAARRGEAERLPGIDTFWYSWVAIHRGSELLR